MSFNPDITSNNFDYNDRRTRNFEDDGDLEDNVDLEDNFDDVASDLFSDGVPDENGNIELGNVAGERNDDEVQNRPAPAETDKKTKSVAERVINGIIKALPLIVMGLSVALVITSVFVPPAGVGVLITFIAIAALLNVSLIFLQITAGAENDNAKTKIGNAIRKNDYKEFMEEYPSYGTVNKVNAHEVKNEKLKAVYRQRRNASTLEGFADKDLNEGLKTNWKEEMKRLDEADKERLKLKMRDLLTDDEKERFTADQKFEELDLIGIFTTEGSDAPNSNRFKEVVNELSKSEEELAKATYDSLRNDLNNKGDKEMRELLFRDDEM